MTATSSDASPPVADLALARKAIEWTQEAGDLTLELFRHIELEVETKGDGTPVTRADRDAEALLRRRIGTELPDDSVHGEEHDDHIGTSGRSWVIDPIDGTLAFSHGVATYSNLVQFSDDHGPAIGIINLPALGECVWAARGHGAFLGDIPLAQLPTADSPSEGQEPLDGKLLCVTGFHHWDSAMFERVHDSGVNIRTWGDAYGYALVATGRAHAMFDPILEWWDLAAVQIVIQEAGGTITRADGGVDVATPQRQGAYGYSALASVGGSHDNWVSLLAGP